MYFLLHYKDPSEIDFSGERPVIVNSREIATIERSDIDGAPIVTMTYGRRFIITEDFEHLLSILDVPHI